MSLTFEQATDEMLDIFKTAWDTTGYEAFYEDVKKQRNTNDDPWATVTLRHAAGFQATLSGATGSKTFRRLGLITFQIFTPIGKGLQDSYALAKVLTDAYEGSSTPGGVWFRDVRMNEIGRDGKFFQTNVLVDFQYDEIK